MSDKMLNVIDGEGLWYLMPLPTIFQLYCGFQYFLGEETRENHQPAKSHRQIFSHYVVSSTPRHERDWSSQL